MGNSNENGQRLGLAESPRRVPSRLIRPAAMLSVVIVVGFLLIGLDVGGRAAQAKPPELGSRGQEIARLLNHDDVDQWQNFNTAHRLIRRSVRKIGAFEVVPSDYGNNENDSEESDEDDETNYYGRDDNYRGRDTYSNSIRERELDSSDGGEIYLLEDKDYPKSLFEDYPRRVGQVSGIATMPNDDVVIFHRSQRHWNETTFNETLKQIPVSARDHLIRNDTIMILDRETGSSLASFGSDLFYMPHSIASDNLGNLWVSDVARHQVMRLPAFNIRAVMAQFKSNATRMGGRHQIWPDLILGEAFVPGSDSDHFCKPSEIVISPDNRLVFIADGYCNRRVMVFAASTGIFIKSFGELDNIHVVHSMTLIEERNLLCVADREGARVLCYNAGLDGDLIELGQLVTQISYPLGRVFAIASISPNHLLVSSNQFETNRYDLSILNPFSSELKLVWTSSDLLEPHSLVTTRNRQNVYAADLSKDAYKKVYKFDIIERGI